MRSKLLCTASFTAIILGFCAIFYSCISQTEDDTYTVPFPQGMTIRPSDGSSIADIFDAYFNRASRPLAKTAKTAAPLAFDKVRVVTFSWIYLEEHGELPPALTGEDKNDWDKVIAHHIANPMHNILYNGELKRDGNRVTGEVIVGSGSTDMIVMFFYDGMMVAEGSNTYYSEDVDYQSKGWSNIMSVNTNNYAEPDTELSTITASNITEACTNIVNMCPQDLVYTNVADCVNRETAGCRNEPTFLTCMSTCPTTDCINFSQCHYNCKESNCM